ncbi:MAG: 30S ribosomal protein S15 [Candidatus Marsarchaeota archaeon]|jgi:small subunit ribosomal protein S15|nr:30S ribosomal protein S15 [Candidatus Marsarchaeota archaeon]
MARMHTGRHGKSKSRKPDVEIGTVPEGFTGTKEQVEAEIVAYAKQGMHQALIGQRLKEKHGLPYIRQLYGKRLNVILKEKGFAPIYPQDMMDLLRRATILRRHIERNHNDVHNKMRLTRLESKIWRLGKYYKESGALPADWKYDPAKVALLIKS